MQRLVSTPDESELPSQAVTVSAWSSGNAVLCYPDGRLCVFCWLFPDMFRWVLPFIAVLVGINWFFQEFRVEDCFPVPPHTQNHLFTWRSVFGVVGVVAGWSGGACVPASRLLMGICVGPGICSCWRSGWWCCCCCWWCCCTSWYRSAWCCSLSKNTWEGWVPSPDKPAGQPALSLFFFTLILGTEVMSKSYY